MEMVLNKLHNVNHKHVFESITVGGSPLVNVFYDLYWRVNLVHKGVLIVDLYFYTNKI